MKSKIKALTFVLVITGVFLYTNHRGSSYEQTYPATDGTPEIVLKFKNNTVYEVVVKRPDKPDTVCPISEESQSKVCALVALKHDFSLSVWFRQDGTASISGKP